MSFSNYIANPDAPPPSALYWDNLKTTVLQGGRVTGIFTGAIGAVAGGIIGCPAGISPVTASIGYIVTSIPSGIVGSIAGFLLSPCFTFAALLTRNFKFNEEIDPYVAQILYFHNNEHYKRYIINQIIQEFKDLEWWRVVSSHESRKLMNSLTEDSLKNSWETLTNYIKVSESSFNHSPFYENNGKKTFDVILSVAQKLKPKSDLLTALNNLQEKEVKKLIHNNPELITETISNKKNLFQLLVLDNNVEAVKLLFKINVITKEMLDAEVDYNSTLLYQTVENGHEEMATILLENFAKETNEYDRYQCYPSHIIHLAAKKGMTKVVEKLADKYKPSINFRDKNNSNRTLLHYAAENGHEDLVKFLIQRNANVNLQTRYGETPLQLAHRKKHPLIANYLVDECQAIDHDHIQLKKELAVLYAVIHHPNWKNKSCDFRLFVDSIHLPAGIIWLQNNFSNPKDLGRDEIFKLASKLKHHDFGCSLFRSEDTKILYQLFKNLGKNGDKSFNQLNAYRSMISNDQKNNFSCS